MIETTVHLVRHGDVHNPGGILYGRLAGYHLSELGRKMSERIGDSLAGHNVVAVISSPLERARETAQPIADRFEVSVRLDDRLVEAANVFEGRTFGVGDGSLRRPAYWRHLHNPFRPSWGEPYLAQVQRMLAAVASARDLAVRQGGGSEAVCVSHQLPIWVTRCFVERRRLWHDPRRRQCSLASVTSFIYRGQEIVGVVYSEPAKDLMPTYKPIAGA
ncbi:MAG: histidine phosphatase family protein [Carbonactinosporaceae bacterium]